MGAPTGTLELEGHAACGWHTGAGLGVNPNPGCPQSCDLGQGSGFLSLKCCTNSNCLVGLPGSLQVEWLKHVGCWTELRLG